MRDGLGSHGEYFDPLALDGRDVLEFRNFDGCFIVKGHVRAQEVVVCDDKSCEGDGAVVGLEATT